MTNCAVYESLRSVNEMKQTMENGLMTLTGCFGVCSKKNRNNRIYEKENYSLMVKNIKERIKNEGCVVGELEHPTGLNINLENISHKITDINIDEDGVISGTIQLLDTPKGKIAQAIIEGGCPLFVSSRACGNVDKEGRVKLEQLVTYDLVGTPGFEEARMHLAESQTFESITESLCIVKDKEENKENNNMAREDQDKLLERIEALETKNEILENQVSNLRNKMGKSIDEDSIKDSIKEWIVESYSPILEKWITEEAAPEISRSRDNKTIQEIKEWVIKDYSKGLQKWVIEEFAPEVEKWIVEQYSPEVQKWITEEYSPTLEKWITEEYSPTLQNWIVEEFAPEVEKWIVEHYSPEVEKWAINEFAPGIQGWVIEQFAPTVESWLNEHYSERIKGMINENLKSNKDSKLESINEVLNLLENVEPKKPSYSTPINENLNTNEPLFIQKMPNHIKPLYEMANDGVKEYINRKAQLYNFTSDESIERFWESVDFNKEVNTQTVYEGLNNVQDEKERAIRAQFRRRRSY